MTEGLPLDGLPVLATALLIFIARVADVSLATLRIALISRGIRRWAPPIALVESLLWLVALGQIVRNLEHPIHYLAFAGGYAAGTLVGQVLDGKLAIGLVAVQVICRHDASGLVEELRSRRFGITTVAARGLKGRVRLLYSVVRRADLGRLLDAIEEAEPDAFFTVSDVRVAAQGFFGSTSSVTVGPSS